MKREKQDMKCTIYGDQQKQKATEQANKPITYTLYLPMDLAMARPIMVKPGSRYTRAERPTSAGGHTKPPHATMRAISSGSSGCAEREEK